MFLMISGLKGLAVNLRTRWEYVVFVRLIELGGWHWRDRYLPSYVDCWAMYKETTCVDAGFDIKFEIEGEVFYYDLNFYEEVMAEVISLRDFVRLQGIGKERLFEILASWRKF